jgi:hypothetical protein
MVNFAKQTPEQVTTSRDIIALLKSVREQRRLQNGGDEFVTDIV